MTVPGWPRAPGTGSAGEPEVASTGTRCPLSHHIRYSPLSQKRLPGPPKQPSTSPNPQPSAASQSAGNSPPGSKDSTVIGTGGGGGGLTRRGGGSGSPTFFPPFSPGDSAPVGIGRGTSSI